MLFRIKVIKRSQHIPVDIESVSVLIGVCIVGRGQNDLGVFRKVVKGKHVALDGILQFVEECLEVQIMRFLASVKRDIMRCTEAKTLNYLSDL